MIKKAGGILINIQNKEIALVCRNGEYSFPKGHLEKNETFLKIDLGLSESEAEIVAARKYYNDIITDYNKLAKKFPSNLIAIIFRYKMKLYYDGKEDFDDKIFKM